MKNKTTAALLAFFLGGIGIQFFYLGKAGKGLLCLLFCWTFIPAIIAIYHFVKFLTMSEEAFNLEYNQQPASPSYLPPTPPVRQVALPAGPTASAAARPARQQVSTTDELEKLFALKEKGAITEEEYTLKKARLLA